MTRPSDWWVLDLDGDPTPGSPSAVRRMARTWQGVADDAAWAQRRVGQLMGDEALGRWIGEAGDTFRDKTGDLPEQLGQCADSYGRAAEALEWWADRLTIHQADADAALVRGRAAREDLEAARERARAAASHASAMAGVGVLTDPSLQPTREQVRDARARLASANAARSSADAAVSSAQGRLDAARALALDAKGLREADGRAAASRIHEAADAGIPERSRWEKLKDWAGEAWDVIVTIAKVVVAVLGVVALIIGGPLAWVVFAAALVLLADAIMKYLDGEGSLWEVGLAALGCIPGTKGLTTLSALRNAFRSGGAMAAGMHVLSSGRAALGEMAAGLRALSSLRRGGSTAGTLGSSPRIYAMWDDLEHVAQFAPEQLNAAAAARRTLAGALGDLGMTTDDLTRLINTPVADLAAGEAAALRQVRNLVTVENSMVLQKVMPENVFDSYILGRADGYDGFDPTQVGGFITRADDAAHLDTPGQVFDGLRLDYTGTPFQDFGETVTVMRFRAEDTAGITTPFHSSVDPSVTRFDGYDSPFTGNGFTGAQDIVPEFHATNVPIQEGAEIWQVGASGNQRLLAVLRDSEWIPQGNP